jgi:hypothetical protein
VLYMRTPPSVGSTCHPRVALSKRCSASVHLSERSGRYLWPRLRRLNPQGGTGAKAGSRFTGSSHRRRFEGRLPISMKPKDPRKGPCAIRLPAGHLFRGSPPISMMQSIAVATGGSSIQQHPRIVKGRSKDCPKWACFFPVATTLPARTPRLGLLGSIAAALHVAVGKQVHRLQSTPSGLGCFGS